MTWLFTTTDFLKVGSIQKILIVAGAREKSCKRRDGKHESAQDTLPRNSAETAGVVGVIPVVAHQLGVVLIGQFAGGVENIDL